MRIFKRHSFWPRCISESPTLPFDPVRWGRILERQVLEVAEELDGLCWGISSALGLRTEVEEQRKAGLVPKSQGGSDEKENLRVLCSACNQSRPNIQTSSESAFNLLARIRWALRDDQREVFDTLKKGFAAEEQDHNVNPQACVSL